MEWKGRMDTDKREPQPFGCGSLCVWEAPLTRRLPSGSLAGQVIHRRLGNQPGAALAVFCGVAVHLRHQPFGEGDVDAFRLAWLWLFCIF